MKVYKFGGASVKDATSIKNVLSVLKNTDSLVNTIVVVSAMGKMTNAFEDVVMAYLKDKEHLADKIAFVENFHLKIHQDLFGFNHPSYTNVEKLFDQLHFFLTNNSSSNSNLVYDQIVSFGELLSTVIISDYFKEQSVSNNWIDVRRCIQTDDNYRDAKLDWNVTGDRITSLDVSKLIVTQGFLGGNENNTTTLGREGSDYTAAIFAYFINAESVTIWKDVAGVLNADPRVFQQTTLLDKVSYNEAIEMAFYGASVIHPKTLQPLKQKNIPLYVRSFVDLNKSGTCVEGGGSISPLIPCFIVKKNQILVSITAKDFSFMMEDNISFVFKKLHDYQLKVNLIQNSALSFSICLEDKFNLFERFRKDLDDKYELKFNDNLVLYTVRHFDDNSLGSIKEKGEVLLKQINSKTVQVVVKHSDLV